MKRPLFAAAAALVCAGPAFAKEPASRPAKTPLGKYPPIIQIAPVDPSAPAPAVGLFHSELGGREVQFLQDARRNAARMLALAELAKGRQSSDEIKAVAEMLGSVQATEGERLEALAGAKNLPPPPTDAAAWKTELAELTGPKFEKAWVEHLIVAAEGSVGAYELGAKSNDAEVKTFADKLLPVAKARLQMANRLGGRSVAPAAVSEEGSGKPDSPEPIAPPISGSAKE